MRGSTAELASAFGDRARSPTSLRPRRGPWLSGMPEAGPFNDHALHFMSTQAAKAVAVAGRLAPRHLHPLPIQRSRQAPQVDKRAQQLNAHITPRC